MTTSLEFQHQATYVGHKVVVTATLVETPDRLLVNMILDTGAEVSLLNRGYLDELPIVLHDGEPIHIIVANGEQAPAWIHPVAIEFLGRPLTIEAAICPDWDTQNLLGMRGFFDQFVVAFDHANHRVYF
jgi:predicted aspartyl protease